LNGFWVRASSGGSRIRRIHGAAHRHWLGGVGGNEVGLVMYRLGMSGCRDICPLRLVRRGRDSRPRSRPSSQERTIQIVRAPVVARRHGHVAVVAGTASGYGGLGGDGPPHVGLHVSRMGGLRVGGNVGSAWGRVGGVHLGRGVVVGRLGVRRRGVLGRDGGSWLLLVAAKCRGRRSGRRVVASTTALGIVLLLGVVGWRCRVGGGGGGCQIRGGC